MRRFTTLLSTTLFVSAIGPAAYASSASCSSALLQAPVGDLYDSLHINSAQAAQILTIRDRMNRQVVKLQRVRPYNLAHRLHAVSLRADSRARSVLSPWQLARCQSEVYYPRPPVRVAYVPQRPVRRMVRPAPHRIVHPMPRRMVRPARQVVHPAPRRTASSVSLNVNLKRALLPTALGWASMTSPLRPMPCPNPKWRWETRGA